MTYNLYNNPFELVLTENTNYTMMMMMMMIIINNNVMCEK